MSTDFDFFNLMLKKRDDCEKSESITTCSNNTTLCIHKNTVDGVYNKICVDCGIEINDNTILKSHPDTNRCNIRRNNEKNIYQDVRDMDISDKVIRVANDLFIEVTSDNIRRGNARRSIVFACVFQAYKILGRPQNPDTLIKLFHITRNAGMRGMKHLNKHIPKNSKIRSTQITPVDIIKNIIEKFNSTPVQENSIINIYNVIRTKSNMLNRSRPLSIAAGIIFYWIQENNSSISLDEFVKTVNLSGLTILKVAKEVRRLLNIS